MAECSVYLPHQQRGPFDRCVGADFSSDSLVSFLPDRFLTRQTLRRGVKIKNKHYFQAVGRRDFLPAQELMYGLTHEDLGWIDRCASLILDVYRRILSCQPQSRSRLMVRS